MLKLGLSAIGLLVVANAWAAAAIAKPPANPGNLITSKSEVRDRMEALSDYQIAYFQQHGQFGKTLKDIGSQKLISGKQKPIAETASYSYQILPHPQSKNMTMIAAVPKQASRPTLIGLISGTQKSIRVDAKGGKETLMHGVLCQSEVLGAAVPDWSGIDQSKSSFGLNCPAGFF
jgi:Type IV pilin-like G and H, putative